MDELTWLHGTDIAGMVRHLTAPQGVGNRKAWRRKFRLWGCACCRQHQREMADPRYRRAVEVAERIAESGEKSSEGRDEAQVGIAFMLSERSHGMSSAQLNDRARHPDPLHASNGILARQWGPFAHAGLRAARGLHTWQTPRETDPLYAGLIREFFGNPFRPARIDRPWLSANGGAAEGIAREAYDGSAFDRLPVLGDALEDAGCRDDAILHHCRSAGPHFLG